MKQFKIITIVLLFAPFLCLAQKDSTKKEKVKYSYFYQISPAVYDFFIQSAKELKNILIYNPQISSDQKVNTQALLNSTITAIERKVKLDSVVLKKDTTRAK